MTLIERFPTYSRAESATDGVVHVVGVPAAVVAATWLIVSVGREANVHRRFSRWARTGVWKRLCEFP